ncbi:hypothetical protein QWZ13_08840 [Reinekea marina]|nr:hypothetical protein [Reinekea marina]MDN3649014.1 hypothetical protein [Reinekea marina]
MSLLSRSKFLKEANQKWLAFFSFRPQGVRIERRPVEPPFPLQILKRS